MASLWSSILANEVALQVGATVLTNLTMIPAIVQSVRRRTFYELALLSATMFTSIMYHMADTVKERIWGMTPGNWHRLDNVFAILSAQTMFIHFADFQTQEVNELVRWICLFITLFFQERGPWVEMHMIIPIALSILLMLVKFAIQQRVPKCNINLLYGSLLALAGVFFFHRGLDDDNDWLRLNHGLWHSFIGLATYFFFRAKQSDLKHRRHRHGEDKKDV